MNKDQLNSFGKDALKYLKEVCEWIKYYGILKFQEDLYKNNACLYPLADHFTGFLYFNDRWPQILDLNGEVEGLIREIDDYTVI